MVYHITREEIFLIALNYLLSFRARKYTEQLVKYPRVLYLNLRKMWMYAYDETLNLIEVRGRGVKIITLLLLLLFQSLTNFTLAWLAFSRVSFLTGAAMGAISVGAMRIYVTVMASIAAFVDI